MIRIKKVEPKNLVYFYISIVAIVVLVGALIWGFLGINLSIDYSGGSQLVVTCQTQDQLDLSESKIISVLKNNKVDIYEIRHQSNGAEYQTIFVTKEKNVANEISLAVRNAVADSQSVEIKGFDNFSSSYKTQTWIIVLTSCALVLAFSIALYFVFKSWIAAITYIISFFATAIFIFSLFIITRIEIGQEVLSSLMMGLIIMSGLAFLLFVRINNQKKFAINHDKNIYQIIHLVRRLSIKIDSIFFGVILLCSVVSVVIGITSLMYFGVGLSLALLGAVFVSYYLLLNLYCNFLTFSERKYEQKKQINKSISSQDTKQEIKTKSQNHVNQKPVSKNNAKPKKKRKRRKKSDDNKVVV